MSHYKNTGKQISIILIVLLIQYGLAYGKNATITNKADSTYRSVIDTLATKAKEANTLKKAKASNNWVLVADTYRTLLYKAEKKEILKYTDSVLWAAKQTQNNEYIGNAYLTRGIMLYNQKQLNKALDNYLLADQYLIKTTNQYAIHKVKYAIAHTKYYLGFYHEAIALFKECLVYFEAENDRAYVTTLHSIGQCYTKIGNYNQTTYCNKLGLQKSAEFQIKDMIPYFKHSEGVNAYFKKEYNKAINQLTAVMPYLKQKNDFANETVANFYIGKSYLKLNNTNKAIKYFIQVDKAFTVHRYTRPDLRECHEILIDHYSNQQNTQAQLKYINNLLKIDSTLSHNYKYLSQKIHKEYDTKKLIQAKEELQQSLSNNRQIGIAIISSLMLSMAILYHQHLKNKKRMKQKFDDFMRNSDIKAKAPKIEPANGELDINPELLENILKNLEKFEKQHKYLEKDMSMVKLAPALKTNSKYAAKVILKYRGKKSIDYITDLKIDYAINLLKTENKYRNYTNKALAEEVGFNSTQKFTKAFKQNTGMSPTFFIQELKKI